MAKKFVRSKPSKKELGTGLDSLLRGRRLEEAMESAPENTVRELSSHFAMLPLEKISANPDQPRKEFLEEELEELTNSIRTHGIIQPMTVRHMGDGSYQIISGERRFRASKRAGLQEVPAFIRTADDKTLLEMALVENIQRQDLNPMEVAYSYLRLQQEFSLTQEQVAKRVGKERPTVSNYLKILRTSLPVQDAIREGKISIGAAKAIAGIDKLDMQELFLKEVLDHPDWSVRHMEKASKSYKAAAKKAKPKTAKQVRREEYKKVEQAFKEFFGTEVKLFIEDADKEKGYVQISFADKEMLHYLYKAVEI